MEFLSKIDAIELLMGAVLLAFGAFHFLLFREYFYSKKSQNQQFGSMEAQVRKALEENRQRLFQPDSWAQARQESEEKLGLIRTLLEILQQGEKSAGK